MRPFGNGDGAGAVGVRGLVRPDTWIFFVGHLRQGVLESGRPAAELWARRMSLVCGLDFSKRGLISVFYNPGACMAW
jgi:hypothetical protein